MLHVTSVAFSFASLFVSAIVFNDIEERAVDPVDRDSYSFFHGLPQRSWKKTHQDHNTYFEQH